MADDKKLTGNEAEKYEAGRTGMINVIDTDTETEAAARERGKEDLINAETAAEEKDDKEKEESDDK